MGTYNPNKQGHVKKVRRELKIAPEYFKGRDNARLQGVNKDLVKLLGEVKKRNPLPKGYSIRINEGKRSLAKQRQYVASGASQTMNSKHLSGNAVDIAIFDDKGNYSKDFEDYRSVANIAKEIATRDKLNFTWGGDWKSLRDGPHFQINQKGPAKNVHTGGDVKYDRTAKAQGSSVSGKTGNAEVDFLSAYKHSVHEQDNFDDGLGLENQLGNYLLEQHNQTVEALRMSLAEASQVAELELENLDGT